MVLRRIDVGIVLDLVLKLVDVDVDAIIGRRAVALLGGDCEAMTAEAKAMAAAAVDRGGILSCSLKESRGNQLSLAVVVAAVGSVEGLPDAKCDEDVVRLSLLPLCVWNLSLGLEVDVDVAIDDDAAFVFSSICSLRSVS